MSRLLRIFHGIFRLRAETADPLFWLRTTVTVFFSSTVGRLVVSKLPWGPFLIMSTDHPSYFANNMFSISKAWKRIKNVNLAPCIYSLIQGRSTKSRDCYFYWHFTFMEMSSFSSGDLSRFASMSLSWGATRFFETFWGVIYPVNHRAGLFTSWSSC